MSFKTNEEIAKRCAEYVAQRAGEKGILPSLMCARLGLNRQLYANWKSGKYSPSVDSLQVLVKDGADAEYLIIGKRRNNGNENCSKTVIGHNSTDNVPLVPDCEHCEWAVDCGTIGKTQKIFCGYGGKKCVNAKRKE